MPVETNSKLDNKLPEPKQIGGSLISLITFLLLFNFLILPSLRSEPSLVPYSQFVKQIKNGKVSTALIEPDEIRFTTKPETDKASASSSEENTYATIPVENDPNLIELLEQNNVEFETPPPDPFGWLLTLTGWVAPPLFFVLIWGVFLQRSRTASGALTVGKSKARIYAEGYTGVTFADVAGVNEAKAELQEIVEFLKYPVKYTWIGAVIPKGVLLMGPPGTGKTLLAKAIAGEAKVPFFSISGSEFVELFVGVGAARVRDLFEQAKRQAPCIVFIDELDALGKARRSSSAFGGNDEQEQTLNQLLTEMDGFEANAGVIIIAATNRPEVLDPALRRPGRFDRQVVVDRPDKQGREAILRVHAKKVKLAEGVDLGAIAVRTPGFAGADLANLLNEAALLAARQDQTHVTMTDLQEAIERVIAGLERRSRILNPMEKEIVSYHEVGHAIIGALMPGSNKVEKISIVPRGVGALGYTLQLPEEDRFLMAEDELRGQIVTLLGGRSAEEVVFNKISTGASDDIQKATDLAERMVTLYGMDAQLGPIAYERVQQQFLDNWQNPHRSISPDVATQIDREIHLIIDAAHHLAQQILITNRALLNEIAQFLLHQEVLEGEPLQQYLQQVVAPPQLSHWLRTGSLITVHAEPQSMMS
jgi:cell division protease FtsH